MKTTIKITIDCAGEYCGDCWKQFDARGGEVVCREFIDEHDDYIELEKRTELYPKLKVKVKRCQQCIDSEVK